MYQSFRYRNFYASPLEFQPLSYTFHDPLVFIVLVFDPSPGVFPLTPLNPTNTLSGQLGTTGVHFVMTAQIVDHYHTAGDVNWYLDNLCILVSTGCRTTIQF